MLRSARTFLATVALLSFIAPLLAGCSTIQRVPFNRTAPLSRASGVTTRSGSKISFAERGASTFDDTLFALGQQGQVRVPTADIAQVWTRKFAPGRTVGLVLGFAFTAAAIAAAISLDNTSFLGGY
jgi:hypothetical protein